jgi:hypothetical protein
MLLTTAAWQPRGLLGTMVTAARGAGQQLARQVATLDNSAAAVIFGAGLGGRSQTSTPASVTRWIRSCSPRASTKGWTC